MSYTSMLEGDLNQLKLKLEQQQQQITLEQQ
jgi:hypothetical protein